MVEQDRQAAAHKAAMQIFESFANAPTAPDSAYVDLDPATTYDPHPNLTSIQETLQSLAPDRFGGAYQTKDGVVHVGMTDDPGSLESQVTAAAPSADVRFFHAAHSWSDLLTITDQLSEMMCIDSTDTLVSVRPDPEANVVHVGVTDLNSPLAQLIASHYGDAISVSRDQPIEVLARS